MADLARFILRGGKPVMAAASAALALPISEAACRAATREGWAALWLGPDEQLLLAPETDAAAIAGSLTAALNNVPHSLVDVSHRQTALEVTGPQAAQVLNAGCPLDFDISAFPVGMCTRTVFAKAEIVLWRTAPERFHIEVWRSFADYVSRLLAQAARG